jgi:hypothetical protein
MLAVLLFVILDLHLLFWTGSPPPHDHPQPLEVVPLIDVHDQPEIAAEMEPASFAEGIRQALADKRYDELEALAATLRDPDRRFRGGTWQLTRFYQIVTEVARLPSDKPCDCTLDPASFAAKKALLEAWHDALPAQPTSAIALAKLWVDAAWSARGGNYAREVTEEQWAEMRENFDHARAYLGKINLDQDPYAYDRMIDMETGEAWDRSTLDTLYARAIKAFPSYYDYYSGYAIALQQKWGGRPGELAAYLASLQAPERGVDGQIAYSFVAYRLIRDYRRTDTVDSEVLNFRAIDAAYQARERRFGLRPHDWKALFYFSLHSGMTVSAIQAFQRMGTDWDSGIWWSRDVFDADIKWYKENVESLAWAK